MFAPMNFNSPFPIRKKKLKKLIGINDFTCLILNLRGRDRCIIYLIYYVDSCEKVLSMTINDVCSEICLHPNCVQEFFTEALNLDRKNLDHNSLAFHNKKGMPVKRQHIVQSIKRACGHAGMDVITLGNLCAWKEI